MRYVCDYLIGVIVAMMAFAYVKSTVKREELIVAAVFWPGLVPLCLCIGLINATLILIGVNNDKQ